MTKPTRFPDWATDTNYPAGPETYAGTPTKVDVPAAQLTGGWRPKQKPPAQHVNADLNLLGQWTRQLIGGGTEREQLLELIPNIAGTHPTMPDLDLTSYPYVLSLTASAGRPTQGSAARNIKMGPGTLLHASDDGVNGPVIYAYTVDGTEAEIVIADAAGAQPRVDLVQIKIEPDTAVTGVKNTMTILVKQGTPHATTPTVPTLDAGYVAYCTVLVGASYAAAGDFVLDDTAGAVAAIHDQRMPLGVRGHIVSASDMGFLVDANGWSYNQQQITGAGTGAAQSNVWAPTPDDAGGRLVAAGCVVQGDGAASMNPRWSRRYVVHPGNATIALNGATPLNVLGSNIERRTAILSQIDGTHTPAAGPSIIASADGIGAPIWSNGRRAWDNPFGADQSAMISTAALEWVSVNDATHSIFRAQFWIAG